MKVSSDLTWILDALQLNLCIKLLGQEELHVFPVKETGQPLSERMLNSFLRLHEMGLIEQAEGGYQCTALMSDRIGAIAYPEKVLVLASEHHAAWMFWGKGTLTMVETGDKAGQQLKVSDQSAAQLPILLSQMISVWDNHPTCDSDEMQSRQVSLIECTLQTGDGAEVQQFYMTQMAGQFILLDASDQNVSKRGSIEQMAGALSEQVMKFHHTAGRPSEADGQGEEHDID